MLWLDGVSQSYFNRSAHAVLTLVLGVDDQLADHRLDYAYVPIERTTQTASKERHPEVGGETDYEKGCDGAEAAA